MHQTCLTWDLVPCNFSVSLTQDAVEVIDVELQAVLNILTEHNFQDAFKNGRSAGNGACAWKGTTSRVMVASRPKVSFPQMVGPVPQISDSSGILAYGYYHSNPKFGSSY
jgi:hypothetical protein